MATSTRRRPVQLRLDAGRRHARRRAASDGHVNLVDTAHAALRGPHPGPPTARAPWASLRPGRPHARDRRRSDGSCGSGTRAPARRSGRPLHAPRRSLTGARRSAPTGAGSPSPADSVVSYGTRAATQVRVAPVRPAAPRLALRPDGKVLAVPLDRGPGHGRVDILVGAVAEARRADPDAVRALEPFLRGRAAARSSATTTGAPRSTTATRSSRAGARCSGTPASSSPPTSAPTGVRVATSSSDGTIRLWDTATSRPIGSALTGLPERRGGRGVHPRRQPPRRRLRRAARATSGTCGRRRGRAAPARSPGARSPQRNGRRRSGPRVRAGVSLTLSRSNPARTPGRSRAGPSAARRCGRGPRR